MWLLLPWRTLPLRRTVLPRRDVPGVARVEKTNDEGAEGAEGESIVEPEVRVKGDWTAGCIAKGDFTLFTADMEDTDERPSLRPRA